MAIGGLVVERGIALCTFSQEVFTDSFASRTRGIRFRLQPVQAQPKGVRLFVKSLS